MSLLIWLVIIAIVYVVSFKNDFTKEKIDKAGQFLVLIGFVLLLLGIIFSL